MQFKHFLWQFIAILGEFQIFESFKIFSEDQKPSSKKFFACNSMVPISSQWLKVDSDLPATNHQCRPSTRSSRGFRVTTQWVKLGVTIGEPQWFDSQPVLVLLFLEFSCVYGTSKYEWKTSVTILPFYGCQQLESFKSLNSNSRKFRFFEVFNSPSEMTIVSVVY